VERTKGVSDVPSSAPASSVSWSPVGHIHDSVLLRGPTRPNVIIIPSNASLLPLRVGVVRIVVVVDVSIARQIASPTLPPPCLDRMGRIRLGSDMRIISRPVEDGRVEVWKIMQQVDKVVLVVAQVVSGSARHADLVFSAEFEPVGFVANLSEEPKPVFWGGRPVFNHLRELVDFGGNECHGGREDRIELAEVGEVPREVEREGVEGMRVLCKESERVRRRWISHSGCVVHGSGRYLRCPVFASKSHVKVFPNPECSTA
jgi:hypothetical protein